MLPGKRLDTIGNIPPRDGLVWYTHALSLSLSIAISAGETDLEQGRVALVRYSLSLYIYILIFGSAPPKKDIYRYIIDWDVIISCGIVFLKIQQETCA